MKMQPIHLAVENINLSSEQQRLMKLETLSLKKKRILLTKIQIDQSFA